MSIRQNDHYLELLFDLQRLDPDEDLRQVIDQSVFRLRKEKETRLDDDVLDIYAAGDIDSMRKGGDGDDR